MSRASTCFAIAALLAVLGGIRIRADGSALKFTLDSGGGIVAQVRIGGRGPYRFLIDTGSNRSALGQRAAAELSAPAVARTVVVSAGSETIRMVVRLDQVAAGSAVQPSVLASVVPDDELRALAPAIDGLLGQDFLSSFDYTIDYRKQLLTWRVDPAIFRAAGSRLTLRASEGRFLVEVPQDDQNRTILRLVPDSGTAMLVLFERDGRVPVRLDRSLRTVDLAGLSGHRRAEVRSAPALRIGATIFRNCPVVLASASADSASDGLLPLRMFDRVAFRARDNVILLGKN